MDQAIWQQVQQAAAEMSPLEVIAVGFALVYVVLAVMENIWCWLAAFISASIYTYICYTSNLKAEAGLQLFYVVMAVVGYMQWRRKNNSTSLQAHTTVEEVRKISSLGLKKNILIIGINIALTFVLGYILKNYLDSANPYVDAFTTVFSLYTTYMVTQKVLENWLYWVVIDAVSIWLYSSRGLYLSALLFGLYTVLAVVGFFQWFRLYKKEKEAVAA